MLKTLTFPVLALAICSAAQSAPSQQTPRPGTDPQAKPQAAPARDDRAATETLLLQQPTIGGGKIAFVYAGDLWVVGTTGGTALRLTSNSGFEGAPQLSRDGRWIAFTGQYDGNSDVYVISSSGGTPRRLTWHPGGDTVLDWHPDGKHVLFRSSRLSGPRVQRAFLVSIDGGTPTPLPPRRVAHAKYSPDGSRIAMTPIPDAFRSWKRYRGGRTTPLWIYDPETHDVEVVPHQNASDTFPAWVGNTLYFGSDRSGAMNLWKFTSGSPAPEQVTDYTDFHIRNIDSDGESLVFEQAGALHVLHNGKPRKLTINVPGDGLAALPRWQEVGNSVRGAELSPNGQRVAFEARGEILTMPRKHGAPRYVTKSSGAHDRSPTWSPDGKKLAWFSDASGEYELFVSDHRGRGAIQRFDLVGQPAAAEASSSGRPAKRGAAREVGGFYFNPRFSPNGKHVLFQDKTNRLAYVTLDNGKVTTISHQQGSLGVLRIAAQWSPDGGYVAFTERDANTAYDNIVVHELASGRQQRVTDGFVTAAGPTWSRDGKFLFFEASVDSGPARFGLDLSTSAARPTSSSLYVAVLAADTENPLAPREDEAASDSDEDTGDLTKADSDVEAKTDAAAMTAKAKTKTKKAELPEVKIDFDDLDQRVLALPLPRGRYSNLVGTKNGLLYIRSTQGDNGNVRKLMQFDFKKRKAEPLTDKVTGFQLSGDGKSLLLASGNTIAVADAKAKKRDPINVRKVKLRVDPAEEWPQVLREVWRLQRDFFYDRNMHGVDWDEMWRRWRPFLAHVKHRQDLNLVIAELIGELSCGHQYVSGGELPDRPDGIAVGLLGADFEVAGDRYRFAKIHRGQNWNPGLRAPLTAPGVNIKAGAILLSVDGREVTAKDNLYGAFETTANRRVELEVMDRAGDEPRTVVVHPIANESALRQQTWIEERRQRVAERSGGRLAYIYMPNTAGAGLAAFERDFYSQLDKEGLILDERYNRGGKVADHVIDILSREVMCYWLNREQWPAQTPFGTFEGPKVMVANEMAGSGGDAMPWLFQRAKLGPLVGTRTWGGLVGISGYPPLVDGGRVTAASFGVMDTNGDWAVENVGVAPDVEVIEWPKQVIAGEDPQLDKAIDLCLEALKTHQRKAKPRYTPPTRR